MSDLEMSPPERELHEIVTRLLDQLETIRDETIDGPVFLVADAALKDAGLDLEAWHLKWTVA